MQLEGDESRPAAGRMALVRQTFIAESRELLRDMESGLLELERAPHDVELLNRVFRAAHTIKGSSGSVDFDAVAQFTHAMESVLHLVRSGELGIDRPLIGMLLECGDHLSSMLDCMDEDDARTAFERIRDEGGRLSARLGGLLEDLGAAAALGGPPSDPAAGNTSAPPDRSSSWHVALRLGPDVLRHGLDPLSFLRYLGTLGTIQSVSTTFDAMPDAARMDPESCYLAVELDFTGETDRATLEDVFDYLRDDCIVEVRPAVERSHGGLSREQPMTAAPSPAEPRTSGAGGHEASNRHAARREAFLRVRADKLDALIDLVGELVIASAGSRVIAQRTHDGDVIESASVVASLVEEVRDVALELRMVPIGETFGRFDRMVRDLASELGKEVDLVLTGTETELDKSMVERISNPLVHLVRNALDHGIEAPESRRRRGKPPRGRLQLNAWHDSGSIVIEVADDGRGLDRERILARAVERGLVHAGLDPAEPEILRLVMEPGFSTAEEITSVSGRGMGLDVVKRTVEALRGSISVESASGEGTSVKLRLPLTLAIIEGFIVGVGRSAYVVPLDTVLECIELPPEERPRFGESGYLNLRGEVLPLLRLREVFEVRGERARRENVVVVDCAGQRAGFVVDALLGEFQTVIKPLGKLFEQLSGISGSTILGNGEVALILDAQALVQRAIGSRTIPALAKE